MIIFLIFQVKLVLKYKKTLKTTIIIPVHNEEANIAKLLNTIFQSKVRKLEIIVINDGSTDSTLKILKNFGKKIKLLNIKKSGVAKARNLGINKSRGSLLLFFDGDVILKKDTIKKFIKYFEENKKLNVLQGVWEKNYIEKTNYITQHLLLKLNFNFQDKSDKEKKYFNFKGVKVSELLTGCLGVRKKVFRNIKFNEGYKKAGGEEFEMGSRIFKKYDIFYTSKIKVYHQFENIFETLKRIFYRTINYSIFILSFKNEKRKIYNKHNETSVPKRDINNLFIVSFLVIFLFLSLFRNEFLYLFIFSNIIFFINNLKFLLFIKKNLDILSLIKSYFVELLIILVKTISIFISIILVYILKQNKFKI